MEYQIQKLVFPTESKHQQCRELFYRGDSGYLDRGNGVLHLSPCQKCDFVTYLNACSYHKWKDYTIAGNISLCLDVSGKVSLCFLGYHKDVMDIVRTEYSLQCDENEGRRMIRFDFPENDETLLGFEITAIGDCCLYDAYYSVEVDENKVNEIVLSMATTTYRKEEFITKNVELLKKDILDKHDDFAEHFYIHIVDNGKTLTDEDIHGDHVFLHPNSNCGGSGGFARGMIESLHQTPEATHVLLMDDDVLVLPESIRRTYNLLKLMKPEHQNDFINGAMLYYEEPERQHEDIGFVKSDGFFESVKPKTDQSLLQSNIDNEKEYLRQDNEYSAWWYCCIPVSVIKENGLPLPLFIRCDDIEYSLRCKANVLTMIGICVWHLNFEPKYNIATDRYQQTRNLLIDQACFHVFKDMDADDFVKKTYRKEIFNFNYNAAEMILKGVEDYLRGPEFLKINQGEKISKENSNYNDKLIPLSEIEGGNLQNVWECFDNPPRKFLDTWLFRITYNGHRFFPEFLDRKGMVTIPYNHAYQPQKVALRRCLLAVNPYNETGTIREKDKSRYQDLQKKYKKLIKYYNAHRGEIEKKWADAAGELVSEEFWREYLGL